MNSAFSPTTQDHVQLDRSGEMQFVKQYLKTFGLTVGVWWRTEAHSNSGWVFSLRSFDAGGYVHGGQYST